MSSISALEHFERPFQKRSTNPQTLIPTGIAASPPTKKEGGRMYNGDNSNGASAAPTAPPPATGKELLTQARAYSAAPTPPPRRKAVGGKYHGLYERTATRHGRVIEFDYYDETGRRRWHSLPPNTSLKRAQAVREKYRVRRSEGERFPPAQVPTVRDSWRQWLADASISHAPRTTDNHRCTFKSRIEPHLGRRKVSDVRKQDVVGLVRDMQRAGYAGWTIHGTLGTLSLFLQWAADQ